MKDKPVRGKAVDVVRAIELYNQGCSINEVGRQLGHHHGVIAYHLYRNGIQVRTQSESQTKPIDTQSLIDKYQQGASLNEISEEVGLTNQAIFQRLIKAGVKTRTISEGVKLAHQRGRISQRGEDNPLWKGGRSIDKDGYVSVRINGNQHAEHRVVWEQAHGVIPTGWVIHHLNGVRDDNRLENLCAMSRKRHSPGEIIKPHQERIRQLELAIYNLKKEAK